MPAVLSTVIKTNFDNAINDFGMVLEQQPNNAKAYNDRGFVRRLKGDFNKAIADFNRAVEIDLDFADAYHNRALAYYHKEDFDRSIGDFSTVIRLKPNMAEAYHYRGAVYYNQDNFEKAIANFTEAIKLDADVVNYHNRGLAYSRTGDFENAVHDFTEVIELQPNNAEHYGTRGAAYILKGDLDSGIADLTQTIKLNPNDAYAYHARGVAHRDKGDLDKAIEDYTIAIQLNPNNSKIYYDRGMAYANKNEVDDFIRDFSKVIELEPDHADAYHRRGLVYSYKGDFNNAIDDFTMVIKLNSNDAYAYCGRGMAYADKGELNEAIADYNTALELKPDFAIAYYHCGRAYSRKGETDQAIEDYTKAIELKPDDTDIYCYRGIAYLTKKDYDLAIEDFSKIIELDPEDVSTYYYLGLAYLFKGNLDDLAIENLNKAIEQNSDHADAYYYRGAAYNFKGELDLAIEDYTNAIQLTPDDSNVYNSRGAVYFRKGEVKWAVEDYTKAIELKPDYPNSYYNRAEALLHLKQWDKAKADLITAKNKGMDIVAEFRNDYKNIEAFEEKHQVKLPADIVNLIRQGFRYRYPMREKVLSPDGEPVESPEVLDLLEKFRNDCTPLGKYVKIPPYFGINTVPTEVFVVDGKTKDELIAVHSSSADILKPFLQGADIRRWQVNLEDQWLIFTYRGIKIKDYPAILKYLKKYEDLLNERKGEQEWYELQFSPNETEHFAQRKLVCPNFYNKQTFAVETQSFYCGYTCYVIPTDETWLCGLLNTLAVEWFYSQVSKQWETEELEARSDEMEQIPVPNINASQKDLVRKLVDYLIYFQQRPTTNSKDLAHVSDLAVLKYFEWIINGLVYEFYMPDVLQSADRDICKHLIAEQLPEVDEIQGDKMSVFRSLYERLHDREHPVRINLFFQDSLRPIRIIEGKW